MLLWLMNLDFAGGSVTPTPVVNSQGGDGFRPSERQKQERILRERQHKQILEEDEIVEAFIKSLTQCLN